MKDVLGSYDLGVSVLRIVSDRLREGASMDDGGRPVVYEQMVDSPPAWVADLPRDSSGLVDGQLGLNYAGWHAAVDLAGGRGTLWLPKAEFLDNHLKTMAQILPLVQRKGVAIHSSSFVLEGRAVVLAAPAGTGKTTALLRASAHGAHVLSEDLTVIGDLDGRPSVYTTALKNDCGIDPQQGRAPLARVYGLRRGRRDRVSRLAPGEAVRELVDNIAIGTRQPPLVAEALRCASLLVDNPGVRRLDCTLDGPFWEAIEEDLADDDRLATEAP